MADFIAAASAMGFCPCPSSHDSLLELDHHNNTTDTASMDHHARTWTVSRRLEDTAQEDPVTWEIVVVSVTIAIMFYFMVFDIIYPDWVMLGGLMIFIVTQIITVKEGLTGFSNEGILTVLALFVVADGISRTGALDYYMGKILGRPTTIAGAQLRLTVPILFISAFFNNTPIVAIMIPVTLRWSKMIGCPKQQLLMPLSYATILGGTCTLVGTSTNLVVQGILEKMYPNEPAGNIQLFDVAVYGVPNAIIGLVYMLCCGPFILPGGRNTISGGAVKLATGEYDDLLIGARVPSWSPAAGRTVKRSGLNNTAGIYLVNVRRATTGNIHRAVSPDFVVSVGDELYFTGQVEDFSTFCQTHGLEILTTENIEDGEVYPRDTTATAKTNSSSDQMQASAPVDICVERLQTLNRISDQIDGRMPVDPGPRPTRVIVTRDAFHTDRVVLVAVDCADRAGLLSDISDALFHRGGIQIKHSEANVVEGRSLSIWRCELPLDVASRALTTEALSDPNNTATLDMVWSIVSQVLPDVVGTDSTTGATATSVTKTSGVQVVRAIVTKNSTLIGKKPMEVNFSSTSIYKAAIVAYQKSSGKNAGLDTPFDAGDLLVLATKEGSPLLDTPPAGFYDVKKESKSISNAQRSNMSKGLSSLVLGASVTSSDPTPLSSNGDDNVDDVERNSSTVEVWTNLRVLFDSNQSASGASSEVPKGEFLTAFTIPPKSPLNDKTLAELGYSKLPGVVLVSCERPITTENIKSDAMSASSIVSFPLDGNTNTRYMPISPDVEKLKVGDVLWFSGSAEAISDLQRINGLAFYQESSTSTLQDRRLIQAVVARGSPLVGRSVIDVDFRIVYGGAVLAIQRGSERVHEHPGAVKLQTGDVLLIEADTSFVKKNTQNYKTFALVTEVQDSSPPRPQMFFLCLIMIAIAFGVSAVESLDQSLLVLSALVGIVMAALGVLTQQEARDAIQWDLYVVVASAFGVSQAMTNSGVAKGLATFLVRIGNGLNIGDAGIYGAIYLAVNLLSSVLTNNAAAVLALPIAMEAVDQTGTDRLKMAFIIMLSASDYITSFGYQTNLMVYGPGEYSNLDFFRFGAPMQVLLWLSSTALVSTNNPDTWYISWIVCFIGFFVVAFLRLFNASFKQWVHARFGKKTMTSTMIAEVPKSTPALEEPTKSNVNNSWHFRRSNPASQ